MNDHLLRYAIDNIWCNPTQDKQFVYELRQITPKYGIRGSYVIENDRYAMPTSNAKDIYHVYQIGKVVPALMGIPDIRFSWIPLSVIANDSLTLAEVYTENGIQFPKQDTYILVTESNNLLVCIRLQSRFPDLDDPTNKPFLRVYHNAYYHSDRSSIAANRRMIVRSMYVKTDEELRQFQISLMDLVATETGTPFYYVNGRVVQDISLVTAAVGDYCEFIMDFSVKRIVEFDISQLPTYHSTLDKERKYILHYDSSNNLETIDFYDDIDVQICKRGSQVGRYSGIVHPRNNGTWIRMLTHKDYGLSVGQINRLISNHPEDPRYDGGEGRWPSDKWDSTADLYLKVIIRHGGYKRPLIGDVNRTHDLYRLSSQNIIRAMTGADAVADVWRAENLERSMYVQFMSAPVETVYPITFGLSEETSIGKIEAQDFAGDALGYHSAAKLIADNPNYVVDASIKVPYNYWENATAFEFDSKGLLLGHHYHIAGEWYYPKSNLCTKVEFTTGSGGLEFAGYYGDAPVSLKCGYGYRLYVTSMLGGIPGKEWIDITDPDTASDYGYLDDTDLANPRWVWTYDPMAFYGYLRKDSKFYLKAINVNQTQGVMRFGLDNYELHRGELINKRIEIPFGQLDVWFNGKALVEGLDYHYENHTFVVNNLEYLKPNVTNQLVVRGTGFCSSDLKMYPPTEIGFVEYGVISSNKIFDIHTNKVQRIIIDGHYRGVDELIFDETHDDYVIDDERNGAPFQIQTPQTTFREVFRDDIAARTKDDIIDQQVSDYLTYYLPPTPRNGIDSIERHYHTYSVFSNKVLHDITKGLLKAPLVNGRLNEDDIVQLLKPYEWLVPFDIINRGYNKNHVKVYPHWSETPIGLDFVDYDFYKKVMSMYLREPLDTAVFIYIKRP